MRRILSNAIIIEEFQLVADVVLQDYDRQEGLFYQFFPKQVEQGSRKPATFKWLVTRCADGTRKTAPRELVHLANEILRQEIRRLERGGMPTTGLQLFDASVFKQALPIVSRARLHAYLYAEYASEKPFVAKLDGEKTEHTLESLESIWGIGRDKAVEKAKELVALGLFEERGTKEEPRFWVPFLYRDALKSSAGIGGFLRSEPLPLPRVKGRFFDCVGERSLPRTGGASRLSTRPGAALWINKPPETIWALAGRDPPSVRLVFPVRDQTRAMIHPSRVHPSRRLRTPLSTMLPWSSVDINGQRA